MTVVGSAESFSGGVLPPRVAAKREARRERIVAVEELHVRLAFVVEQLAVVGAVLGGFDPLGFVERFAWGVFGVHCYSVDACARKYCLGRCGMQCAPRPWRYKW